MPKPPPISMMVASTPAAATKPRPVAMSINHSPPESHAPLTGGYQTTFGALKGRLLEGTLSRHRPRRPENRLDHPTARATVTLSGGHFRRNLDIACSTPNRPTDT